MMGETAKQEAIRALFPALLVLRYGVELRAALATWAAAPLGWGGVGGSNCWSHGCWQSCFPRSCHTAVSVPELCVMLRCWCCSAALAVSNVGLGVQMGPSGPAVALQGFAPEQWDGSSAPRSLARGSAGGQKPPG